MVSAAPARHVRRRSRVSPGAQACALLSQKFVSHELPPRDACGTRSSFPAAVRVAVAPEHLIAAADRVLAGRYSFFDLDRLRARRSAAVESRSADASRGRHAPRQRHRLSRRARSREHQVPVGAEPAPAPADAGAGARAHRRSALCARASRRRSTRGSSNARRAAGPNWVSALELGIRLINWSITWQLLGGMRAQLFATPDGVAFRERWLSSIYEQARMIAGNLSRFSSANNHLIGEAAGVYVAASTWPLWPQMRRLGRALPAHSRRGMPPAERTRRRQSRTGLRLPDLRARFPADRRARGARRAARISRRSTGGASRS